MGNTVLRPDTQQVDVEPHSSTPALPRAASADYPPPGRFTHAIWARDLARLARLATQAMAAEAEGMWNPDFCSSDARPWALSVIEDARHILDWAELRITRHVDVDDGDAKLSSTANTDETSDIHTK